MAFSNIQDRIQYLTYRSTEPDFTPEEEAELVRLLKKREACPEYQREQVRKRFFLSLMR